MSRICQRWVWGCVLLLVFIVYGVWSRQQYLKHLKVEAAQLSRELHETVEKNRALQQTLQPRKELMEQEATQQEIEVLISHFRELPFLKPVHYAKMKRPELRKYILSKLGAQYSPEEFANYELALKRIGLIPHKVNLVEIVADLLSEQIAAFYDPDTHELYTFNELTLANNMERMILAHELVHALQDQHFDFRALALRAKDNDDAAVAAAALVEGDASYQMGVYLRQHYKARELLGDLQVLFSQPTDKIVAAPAFIRDSLLFPYEDGQVFVSELHARGGNAAIDACFANPPTSTEQVLHPEKYSGPGKDIPVVINLEIKAASASWKKLHQNVVGELGIRSFFTAALGLEKASEAAAGWGGDSYSLYSTGAESWVLVWKTVWDSPKDAREFFDALESFYHDRYGSPSQKEKTTQNVDAVFFSEATQKQSLSIKGSTVLYLDVPDLKIMKLLLSEFGERM